MRKPLPAAIVQYVQANENNLGEVTLAHLRALYQELIRPLERWVEGCRRCIVVPHGVLHRVPFHVLNDGERDLIDRFAISYAPSASVYRLCATQTHGSRQQPLIVGVEDPRIPFVVEETANLRQLWPEAVVLRNDAATVSNFTAHAAAAGMIHVATHADFRQDNPMFSSIRLSDRWMNVAEIHGLETEADLVTLSGCGTGLGSLRSGDEMIGLVRGFLYAGARCLLVSLWDVHDGSASQMMRHFYERAASGLSFAEALQSAMLAVREAQPHPYYWGSFRLVGWAG